MADRVLFKNGKQREFLNKVLIQLHCVSLQNLLQIGFAISYAQLKNYYSERRLLPRNFFEELLYLSKINLEPLHIEFISGNWGQVKGGKKGKRLKIKKM